MFGRFHGVAVTEKNSNDHTIFISLQVAWAVGNSAPAFACGTQELSLFIPIFTRNVHMKIVDL